METNDFNSLLKSMKNTFISNMARKNQPITDLNEGSIVMTMFESFGNVLEQAYIDTRLGFQSNLNSLATSLFDFKKKSGQYATATKIVFSRGVALDTPVTISAGTIISDGTYNFTTTQTATIPANSVDSNEVTAQANGIGTNYNLPPHAINTIVSVVSSEVIAVDNGTASTGGADQETEAEMLSRFKTYINGLQGTNRYGIEAGLLSNPKIRSVGVEEHPQALQGYNVTVYIDDGTGSMSQELEEEVKDIINGNGTSVTPGLRAAGINVDVQPCSQIPIDIEANIVLYRVEEAYADAQLKDTLERAINGLKINESVLYADVMTALKQTGSYIKNITHLKINNLENTDVSIAVNQIARLDDAVFNYTYGD